MHVCVTYTLHCICKTKMFSIPARVGEEFWLNRKNSQKQRGNEISKQGNENALTNVPLIRNNQKLHY